MMLANFIDRQLLKLQITGKTNTYSENHNMQLLPSARLVGQNSSLL